MITDVSYQQLYFNLKLNAKMADKNSSEVPIVVRLKSVFGEIYLKITEIGVYGKFNSLEIKYNSSPNLKSSSIRSATMAVAE